MPDESAPANFSVILEELRILYWAAVEKEASNIIEFHAELLRSKLNLDFQADLDSANNNFKKIFDVWCKWILLYSYIVGLIH
jgi:hypothetical protein